MLLYVICLFCDYCSVIKSHMSIYQKNGDDNDDNEHHWCFCAPEVTLWHLLVFYRENKVKSTMLHKRA